MDKSHSEQVCPKDGKKVSWGKCTKIPTSKPAKSLFGTCCVCHKTPQHSRKYYGHLFCIKCFYKYIWSAPSAGDAKSFSYEDFTKFTDQMKQV